MIELKNVNKYYTNGQSTSLGLRNINLKFNKNEIVAITGESGSGKSTLLNVITKIDNFDEGEIYYYGNETSYFSISDMDDFRKNKIGFIFQNYNIIDSYTVLENVMLPLTLKGYSNDAAKKKALSLIEKVGLKGHEKNRGTKLSGGEKQRCVIARALASDCEILACDEPTGNLDQKTAKQIIELIKEVAEDKLVLIVTHNFDEVKDIVTRQIRVADGQIIEDIKFNDVADDENKTLDLDYKCLNRKITTQVAKNNVIFTPKKTFFVFLIMLIISIIFFADLQSIKSTSNLINTDTYKYGNYLSNQLIIYHDDSTMIDVTKLSNYDIKINNFSSQSMVDFKIGDYYFSGYATTMSDDYELVEGRLPQSDDEFVLLVGSSDTYDVRSAKGNLNKTIELPSNYIDDDDFYADTELLSTIINNYTYKFVGICTYESTESYSNTYIVGSDRLLKMLDILSSKLTTYLITDDGYSSQVYNVKYLQNSDKVIVYLPTEYIDEEYSVKCTIGIRSIEYGYAFNDYSIVYKDDISPYVSIGMDYDLSANPYIATLSTTTSTKDAKEIRNLGFNVDIINTKSPTSKLLAIFEFVISTILTIVILIQLVVSFFISYIILAKIYASKFKDYEILRTLGITKKDMSVIVKTEVVLIFMLAAIVGFIGYTIFYSILNKQFTFFNYSFIYIVIYFVSMLIFSILMGTRFNKKLFKFTISKSMKDGGLND